MNELMTLDRAPVQQMPEFSDLVANFLMSLDVKPATVAYYARCFKQYTGWINETGITPVQISREDIISYKRALIDSGRSSLTIASYLQIVKGFYAWISDEFGTRNISRNIKSPPRQKKFRRQPLTPEQASQLLDHFSQGNIRDYAMVNILIRCGLRTIELSRLNVDDLRVKSDRRVLMVQGKGHTDKDNFVVLSPKCDKVLSEYVRSRGRIVNGLPLFTSVAKKNHGGRIGTYTISRIVKTGLRAIGLDSVELSAHSLRHTCATSILSAGGSMGQAQGVLRHMSSETTAIYTSYFTDKERLENPAEFLIDQLF
ncbi:Tyrosine recombinase XerD [subsurface metagenome]